MRSADSWFNEYAENHRNPTNIIIHWICVPAIFFSVLGLLASIPPHSLPWLGRVPWAKMAIALALVLFYLRLSPSIAIGMGIMSYGCLFTLRWLQDQVPWPLWVISLSIFAAAWVGQFYGHKIEGRKPSFLKDLAFLLVGPAWLVAKVYKRIGVPY